MNIYNYIQSQRHYYLSSEQIEIIVILSERIIINNV
jgi:hypothetical protein